MLKLVVVHPLPKIMVAESEFDPSLVCTELGVLYSFCSLICSLEEPPISPQPQHIHLPFYSLPLRWLPSNPLFKQRHTCPQKLAWTLPFWPRLHYKVVGIITVGRSSPASDEKHYLKCCHSVVISVSNLRLLSLCSAGLNPLLSPEGTSPGWGYSLFLSDMVDLKLKSFSFRSSGVRPQ